MRRVTVLRRLSPVLAAAAFFALMATLYALDVRTIYTAIIRCWGINPWPFAFFDTDTILSAVRCRQAGFDVYAWNPCDALGRVYDYSPLWLAVAHIPGIGRPVVAIGLTVDLAFLLALALLPPGRRWRDTAVVTIGAVSSAVLYAMERGNNDLVIFTLAALAAELSCRSRGVRLIGYGAALLGGLLKYYPMAVMALAVREAPRRFFAITGASVLTLALFVAVYGDELVRALALIPDGAFISDMFGSSTLPGGLFGLFGAGRSPLRPLVHAAMVAGGLAAAAWIGSRAGTGTDIATLTERERAFLMAGAMLMLGCFFTAQNIGYRALHLLLALPALTALAHRAARPRRYRDILVAAVLLLWAEGWRHEVRIATLDMPAETAALCKFVTWLLREALWWWVIVTLGSLAVAMLLRSEMGVATMRLLGKRPRRTIRVVARAA